MLRNRPAGPDAEHRPAGEGAAATRYAGPHHGPIGTHFPGVAPAEVVGTTSMAPTAITNAIRRSSRTDPLPHLASHSTFYHRAVRFDSYSFGEITIDGVAYDHDVVIDHGSISKRKKAPSKPYRDHFGHTPLSAEESIPWNCRRPR